MASPEAEDAGGRLAGSLVTADPLEPLAAPARDEVRTDHAGAVVTFEGVVRDHDGGRSVRRLDYEAHPAAEEELAAACRRVLAKNPGVRAWVGHRTGALELGELAFLVAVAAAHRGAAFAACAALVDEVKATVPIWKRQLLSDGLSQWVGLE
ncbi:molybdenum cofactor biosynthesis protein MoaE [Corynebacterium otitidis]|uniref:Molybdopterin-converting factor subunit 2 2 n=1 Tax=Corynebacterium otitidis ATCC 51513 TaxID=883169 RepID=I7LBS4_9CORY|nr:molybdenum cofactor biosynthesis protein MoaE [Corynebacterium otitidis]EJZ82170.1 hypothetical protein HMPREF9719_00936 [Corynebacterium otitidis ATCC 51513]KKO83732.1 molybdopterin converting factor [Corynebacterium otitidis]CCI83334.1 Molybdopterin-converting factor subunit 2 2 [Corynebacterium otitidis ATCC 51513]